MTIRLVPEAKLGDSPAHNSEAESLIYQLAKAAVEAGNWISVPIDSLNANPDLQVPGIDRANFESPTREGLNNLVISGLAIVEEVDGKRVLTPTDFFKEWYSEISN